MSGGPWEKYQQAETPPWEKYAAPTSPGFWDQLKRAGGQTGRIVAQGATDLASIPGDLAVALYNLGNQKPYQVTLDDGTKVTRGGPMPMPSETREQFLTDIGLPEPETPLERIVNLAGRGMVGGGGTAAVASRIPGGFAAMLAQRPGLQTISGATGGAAAGTAHEHGAGPIGQTVAGLLGAGVPALATPRASYYSAVVPQEARAAAGAHTRVTPGASAAESMLQAAPEARATGGGYTFGHVGPDESAGLTAPRQSIGERGAELGFRLTPGQATGSRALQQMEAKLESQPMTSGPFNTIKAHNTRALNRAAAEAIGEKSDALTSDVLARASDRIGQVYENVADDVARPIDPREFVGFLSGLQDETRGLVSGLTSNPLVEDLVSFASQGAATGRQLQSLGSKLGKAAYKNMSTASGDRDLGIALYRVKDYVDDLLVQGMEPDRAATFDAARGQYRNLMLLTQRVGVVNPTTGDVSGRSLANTLQGKDRRGFTFGENRSPMYEAARFSQAFAPIVGDSGTATRVPLQGLTDLVTRLPLWALSRTYTSSPAVDLAVGAQASARSAANLGRALREPLGSGDIPAAGMTSAEAARLSDTERRRRRMIEALMAEEEE